MNILICDDIAEESLKLEETIKVTGFEGNIVRFCNGKDAFAHIQSGMNIDVCFLDIIMPQMDGIALSRRLRAEKYQGEIVFLTTTNEHAAESYQVGAYDYLLKPPNAHNIAKILRGITDAQKATDTAGIPIETRTLTRFLFFHEISHVEVMGKKVYFYLINDGCIEINATFSDLLPIFLADRRFAQCHRSYLINMDAVSYIQGRDVFFRDGKKAPISRNYAEFDNQYIKWVFSKEK